VPEVLTVVIYYEDSCFQTTLFFPELHETFSCPLRLSKGEGREEFHTMVQAIRGKKELKNIQGKKSLKVN